MIAVSANQVDIERRQQVVPPHPTLPESGHSETDMFNLLPPRDTRSDQFVRFSAFLGDRLVERRHPASGLLKLNSEGLPARHDQPGRD